MRRGDLDDKPTTAKYETLEIGSLIYLAGKRPVARPGDTAKNHMTTHTENGIWQRAFSAEWNRQFSLLSEEDQETVKLAPSGEINGRLCELAALAADVSTNGASPMQDAEIKPNQDSIRLRKLGYTPHRNYDSGNPDETLTLWALSPSGVEAISTNGDAFIEGEEGFSAMRHLFVE